MYRQIQQANSVQNQNKTIFTSSHTMWYDFQQLYTHTNESTYLLIKIITSEMYANVFVL